MRRILFAPLLRCLPWISAMASIGAYASAQGQPAPTPIEMAVAALNVSHPLPPGWKVEVGEVQKGAMAEIDPDAKTIRLDPDAAAASFPRISEHDANLPGVLYILLLHEWYHVDELTGGGGGGGSGGNYNTSPPTCGDIQLIPVVAAAHCELICDVLYHGNGNIGPLCDLYQDIRDNYNNGTSGNGGASGAQEALDCPGTYPGDIPPCPCCPSIWY